LALLHAFLRKGEFRISVRKFGGRGRRMIAGKRTLLAELANKALRLIYTLEWAVEEELRGQQ
jgi:hypothetical protein